MPRPRLYKTEGIVLRHSPLGEADRLLTVLTPGLGKLRLVARGVRRVTSRLGGHLDALNRVALGLARGQNLDVVTSAEAMETFRPLKENLEGVAMGIYAAELVDAFMPQEAPNPTVYSLLLETLHALATPGDHDLALRYVELRLLEQSGFLPELDCCVACRAQAAPDQYAFAPVAGGLLCPACAHGTATPISVKALVLLRQLRDSPGAEARCLSPDRDSASEMEALLAACTRSVLEQGVASASFLAHLRSLPRQG